MEEIMKKEFEELAKKVDEMVITIKDYTNKITRLTEVPKVEKRTLEFSINEKTLEILTKIFTNINFVVNIQQPPTLPISIKPELPAIPEKSIVKKTCISHVGTTPIYQEIYDYIISLVEAKKTFTSKEIMDDLRNKIEGWKNLSPISLKTYTKCYLNFLRKNDKLHMIGRGLWKVGKELKFDVEVEKYKKLHVITIIGHVPIYREFITFITEFCKMHKKFHTKNMFEIIDTKFKLCEPWKNLKLETKKNYLHKTLRYMYDKGMITKIGIGYWESPYTEEPTKESKLIVIKKIDGYPVYKEVIEFITQWCKNKTFLRKDALLAVDEFLKDNTLWNSFSLYTKKAYISVHLDYLKHEGYLEKQGKSWVSKAVNNLGVIGNIPIREDIVRNIIDDLKNADKFRDIEINNIIQKHITVEDKNYLNTMTYNYIKYLLRTSIALPLDAGTYKISDTIKVQWPTLMLTTIEDR